MPLEPVAEDGPGPGPGMFGTGFARPKDDQRDIVGGVAVQRRGEQALGDRFEVVSAERGAQLLVAAAGGSARRWRAGTCRPGESHR